MNQPKKGLYMSTRCTSPILKADGSCPFPVFQIVTPKKEPKKAPPPKPLTPRINNPLPPPNGSRKSVFQ